MVLRRTSPYKASADVQKQRDTELEGSLALCPSQTKHGSRASNQRSVDNNTHSICQIYPAACGMGDLPCQAENMNAIATDITHVQSPKRKDWKPDSKPFIRKFPKPPASAGRFEKGRRHSASPGGSSVGSSCCTPLPYQPPGSRSRSRPRTGQSETRLRLPEYPGRKCKGDNGEVFDAWCPWQSPVRQRNCMVTTTFEGTRRALGTSTSTHLKRISSQQQQHSRSKPTLPGLTALTST